ncbi:MAG: diaminopimelate epimerase [Planctomycetia bacterium]|nr:diaminopimelate epimerase [Planctomycetia bacterium]
MRFTKMHGAGNDYVYIDLFREKLPVPPEQLAPMVSDRHFGVGSDGLVLICPSDIADVQMRMFNSDGSESEMCGNALRCVAKYVAERNLSRPTHLKITSGSRLLTVNCEYEGERVTRVRVDMGEPILTPADVPTNLRANGPEEAPVADLPVESLGLDFTKLLGAGSAELASFLNSQLTCVSMGNPHCVIFVDKITDDLVLGCGPIIERSLENFPRKINVEFIERLSDSHLRMRVWERGTGETLACGTGASATAVASALTGRTGRKVRLSLLGGELEIEWNAENNHVFMTGPAVESFSGELTDEFFKNRRPEIEH